MAVDQNSAQLTMTGNQGNDTLVGSSTAAFNHLNAGVGIDTLIGGGAGSENYFGINKCCRRRGGSGRSLQHRADHGQL